MAIARARAALDAAGFAAAGAAGEAAGGDGIVPLALQAAVG